MKGLKLPQLGQKVELRIVGTINSVEQSQPAGVSGAIGDLDVDVTEVKILPVSDFSQLLDE